MVVAVVVLGWGLLLRPLSPPRPPTAAVAGCRVVESAPPHRVGGCESAMAALVWRRQDRAPMCATGEIPRAGSVKLRDRVSRPGPGFTRAQSGFHWKDSGPRPGPYPPSRARTPLGAAAKIIPCYWHCDIGKLISQ